MATGIFATINRDWQCTYANDAAKRLWDRGEQVVGLTAWDLFPERSAAFESALRRAMSESVMVEIADCDFAPGACFDPAVFPTVDGVIVYARDVGDRKRTEQQLRESEGRYRKLFESIDEGFCVIEILLDGNGHPVDYRFLETNVAFDKQLGFGGVVGRRVLEFLPQLERWWIEVYGRVALTGEPIRIENQVGPLKIHFDVFAFRLGGPESRQVAVLFNNITARKEAERALRASEERWGAVFDNSGVGLTLNDANGLFVRTNRVYQQMLGYTAEELRAMSWVEITHQDDLRVNEDLGSRLWSGELSYFQLEKRYYRKDGTVIWARNTVSLAPGTETVPRFALAIVEDITERKRAEDALRCAFDTLEQRVAERTEQLTASNEDLRREIEVRKRAQNDLRRSEISLAEAQRLRHVGSGVWNVTTHAAFWSDETYRIFGLEPGGAEPSYGIFFGIVHPEERAALQEGLASALRENRHYDLEFRIVRADGSIRNIHSIGRPVFDNAGQIIEFIATVIDVTERKLSEETLQTQMAELKRVEAQRKLLLRQIVNAQERERQRIAREMHDQLGQQLSALTMKLSTFKCQPDLASELRTEFNSIESAVKQLDAEVDFLARELRPRVLDDLGLLEALSNYVDTWSRHFGIHVELQAIGMEQRLDGEVETVLYRVTQEALNNVAKHARATNVGVLLNRNTSHVCLIVEDDGIGFDYKQALGTGEDGLGLIGMRERAELIGGSLDIEAPRGQGTTIIVRIPI